MDWRREEGGEAEPEGAPSLLEEGEGSQASSLPHLCLIEPWGVDPFPLICVFQVFPPHPLRSLWTSLRLYPIISLDTSALISPSLSLCPLATWSRI